MKLCTILNLKNKIEEIKELMDILETDYLNLLDDDLWTIDLETRPYFTKDYDVTFTTEVRLTKKYIIRFCEDYGLSLKDYKEVDDGYVYVFEVEKDIMKNLYLVSE